MDYMNEFLDALRDGETVEGLARQLTKALNEANRKYEEEVTAKSAAREAKIGCITDMINAIGNILDLYNFKVEGFDDVSRSDIEDLVDELDNSMPALVQELSKLDELSRLSLTGDCFERNCSKQEKDPIEAFLNKYVR